MDGSLKLYNQLGLRFSGFFCHTLTVNFTFGIDVAINKFDDSHWRIIAIAEARFHDADITAWTVRITGAENVKKFL